MKTNNEAPFPLAPLSQARANQLALLAATLAAGSEDSWPIDPNDAAVKWTAIAAAFQAEAEAFVRLVA